MLKEWIAFFSKLLHIPKVYIFIFHWAIMETMSNIIGLPLLSSPPIIYCLGNNQKDGSSFEVESKISVFQKDQESCRTITKQNTLSWWYPEWLEANSVYKIPVWHTWKSPYICFLQQSSKKCYGKLKYNFPSREGKLQCFSQEEWQKWWLLLFIASTGSAVRRDPSEGNSNGTEPLSCVSSSHGEWQRSFCIRLS